SLAVVPAAGGAERVLASGYGISGLRWAVDGSAIYYASYQDSAKTKAALRKVAVNGGSTELVHDFSSGGRAPTLSPDNRVIALSQDATRPEQAVRIGDLNGRALADLSIPVGVDIGDWSGEFRQAGVRQVVPRALRIVNVADGESRELIDSTGDVQAVTW